MKTTTKILILLLSLLQSAVYGQICVINDGATDAQEGGFNIDSARFGRLQVAPDIATPFSNTYRLEVQGKGLFTDVLKYSTNLGSFYDDRTLIDRGYADARYAPISGGGGLPSLGTARQILTVNEAGNGLVYRTVSTGTSGNGFNIGYGASTMTLNMPMAYYSSTGLGQGLVDTIAQIWKGPKSIYGPTSTAGAPLFTVYNNSGGGNAHYAHLRLQTAGGGDIWSPGGLAAESTVGKLSFASAGKEVASLWAFANEATNYGTRLVMYTTPNGTNSSGSSVVTATWRSTSSGTATLGFGLNETSNSISNGSNQFWFRSGGTNSVFMASNGMAVNTGGAPAAGQGFVVGSGRSIFGGTTDNGSDGQQFHGTTKFNNTINLSKDIIMQWYDNTGAVGGNSGKIRGGHQNVTIFEGAAVCATFSSTFGNSINRGLYLTGIDSHEPYYTISTNASYPNVRAGLKIFTSGGGAWHVGKASGSDKFILEEQNAGDYKQRIRVARGGGVAIGGDGTGTTTLSDPPASAMLEVQSTTKGVILCRMTTAQRTAISSPQEGTEVYDLDLHKKMVYDGTTWQACW